MNGILKKFYTDNIYDYLHNTFSSLSPYICVIVCSCIVLASVLTARHYYTSYICRVKVVKMLDTAITKRETINCIKIIEKYPSLVNAVENSAGYTPFLKACLYGNTQLIKYMLQKGANVSVTTNKGESAFYLAAYNRICNSMSLDATCLHALYYAGADINLPNANGFTPLQMAAMFGHTPLVNWLLSKGADMNVFPTPVSLARSQGHLQTASVLQARTLKAIMQ